MMVDRLRRQGLKLCDSGDFVIESLSERERKRGEVVLVVSGCADTNRFRCGTESQTKRPASASNVGKMIGSRHLLVCRHHLDITGLIALTAQGWFDPREGYRSLSPARGRAGNKAVEML